MDTTQLEWKTFDGSLPDGAVSIYNGYEKRYDYVAKYGSSAGFYNPNMGAYCHYSYGDKEHYGSPFEILVNKDDFEFLEWKGGSYGSVPNNSVYTYNDKDVYVGKNEYGLGKVVPKHQAFFLPWEGKEYWYKNYQVLTFDKDVRSEHITDVKYNIDDVQIIAYPPDTVNKSTVTNKGSSPVTETVTLQKTVEVEQRWDSSFSVTTGASISMTAGVPEVASTTVTISVEATFQFSKGTSRTESTSYSLAVECQVPPKHYCTVKMVAYKYGADIPYTARLKRVYRNGETRWTSITGTYKGVTVGEVRAVVEPCEPLVGFSEEAP